MPALNFNNPKAISFLLENYEKEKQIRMKWVQLHAGKFEKASTFTREEKNYTTEDITKTVMDAGMVATTRDHITAARHRMTTPLPDCLHVKVGASKDIKAPMKPVAREVKDTLLKSRLEYLKERSLLKPEDKYHFVESSNWLYGWKLDESQGRMSGPVYGKVYHLRRNIRSRVGPQRDPDYYNSPDSGNNIFLMI